MKIAAVIVTHNRKAKLAKAIDSLLEQTMPIEQIVVVDNQSTDDTAIFLEGLAKDTPQLDVIYSKDNLGGAGGFSLALERVMQLDVDWVSIADDDAIYDANYMAEMAQLVKQKTEIDCFTGTVIEDGSIGTEHRVKIDNMDRLQLSKIGLDNYQDNFKIDIATFVGVFLKQSVLKQIGLPEKDFFIWYDDIEYSLRIRAVTDILNNVKAKIYHLTDNNSVGATGFKRPITWKDYYGYRNRWKTMALHCKNHDILRKQLRYEKQRYIIGAFLKKKGQYSRLAAAKLVKAAYQDFENNKMGKNDLFLP
ncbi:glycosyltransferase [Latilactobacillus curvatus]|uniref:glycosyltransferase n=1 Tax=Latilactobacillus curvatus TaxID=28038 RepID=UPI000977ED10|nr:glycosyltransferase [Latilactobacillus curvatus]MCT1215316.1 glycosyltransferase [Latilactobacillus curvatus]MDG2982451.1 glycosyltransferase [Latilactobacillus curvatus]WRS45785.1 glycosyltransferase [Latilactobacillus curvatus]